MGFRRDVVGLLILYMSLFLTYMHLLAGWIIAIWLAGERGVGEGSELLDHRGVVFSHARHAKMRLPKQEGFQEVIEFFSRDKTTKDGKMSEVQEETS